MRVPRPGRVVVGPVVNQTHRFDGHFIAGESRGDARDKRSVPLSAPVMPSA